MKIKTLQIFKLNNGFSLNIYTEDELIMAGYDSDGKLSGAMGFLNSEAMEHLIPTQICFVDKSTIVAGITNEAD